MSAVICLPSLCFPSVRFAAKFVDFSVNMTFASLIDYYASSDVEFGQFFVEFLRVYSKDNTPWMSEEKEHPTRIYN